MKRLIIVEGLPVSEKSAVASMISKYLQQHGDKAVFYNEGSDCPVELSDCVFADLATEKECVLNRWREFVSNADKDAVYVLNGTLLQQPLTSAVTRFDLDEQAIKEYAKEILQIAKPLDPVVLYLKTANVKQEEEVNDEGNEERLAYLAEQTGTVQDEQGDGEEYATRQEEELRILRETGVDCEVFEEAVTDETLPALVNKLLAKRKHVKKELWRMLKYTLFAISAGVIQIVSSLVLKAILGNFLDESRTMMFINKIAVSSFIAETVALALSIIWNFTFNRKFTFKVANNVPVAMLLAFLFYVPFYPFQTWYIGAVESKLSNIGFWGFAIAQGTVMIINFVLEFLWQQFVVFRGKLDTNDLAQKQQAGEKRNQADEQDERADK